MGTEGNTTLNSLVQEAAQGLGLLLYLVDPGKSSYSSTELCPDYVGQVSTRYSTRMMQG
jgi:hypothetical protein